MQQLFEMQIILYELSPRENKQARIFQKNRNFVLLCFDQKQLLQASHLLMFVKKQFINMIDNFREKM